MCATRQHAEREEHGKAEKNDAEDNGMSKHKFPGCGDEHLLTTKYLQFISLVLRGMICIFQIFLNIPKHFYKLFFPRKKTLDQASQDVTLLTATFF